MTPSAPPPTSEASRDRELGRVLEAAIEALPDPFRAVFVLRRSRR